MNKGTILSTLLLAAATNAFTPVPTFTSSSIKNNAAVVRPFSKLAARTQPGDFDYALIFDCDGVIIETEELHRLAYNAAFKAADLQIDGEPVV
jgi:hypothetical protein